MFGLMVVVDGFDPFVLGLMVVINGFFCNLNLGFVTKIKAKRKGSELGTSQSKKKRLKHIGGVKRKHSRQDFWDAPTLGDGSLGVFQILGTKV